MSSTEYHDHPALGQLVTGTVGRQSFRYWVAQNTRNKMNFARDYIETYENKGKQKGKPRSIQNFHGYFITPDAENCIIVDENNPEIFRVPRTADEKNKAKQLLEKYRKKYPNVTPQQHLEYKERKIASGEWKRGNRRGQQGKGPPAGSIPVSRTGPMIPPPPAAMGPQGFPQTMPSAFLPMAPAAPMPAAMPVPNMPIAPATPMAPQPYMLPPAPSVFTLPVPSVSTATWAVPRDTPQYTVTQTGPPTVIRAPSLIPLQPRGHFPSIEPPKAQNGPPRPSHPAHSDTTTFCHIRYPSDFFRNVVEKNPIFSICRNQLARLNQAMDKCPSEHFATPFERLNELIKEILVEWDEKTNRFDPAKIGKAVVKVQQRLEAFIVMHCIHHNHVNNVIKTSHENLETITAKDFTEYYTALKKVFEYDESGWKLLAETQKKSTLQKVFIGLQHGIAFTLLQLHQAQEQHKNAMSAISSLTSTLTAAGVPPAPMGHTSRASEDASERLKELVDEVSSTIQRNQDINAPNSKTARVEYYKGLLHSKRDSLSEDHSPAACLLTLAHEKALNLHYFRHCVTKFSDEFVQAVNETFNIKSEKTSLVQYI